jgi:hypothetical protein
MMKIAVFTIKGGVGKTALVLLLGLAFATEFKKKYCWLIRTYRQTYHIEF